MFEETDEKVGAGLAEAYKEIKCYSCRKSGCWPEAKASKMELVDLLAE